LNSVPCGQILRSIVNAEHQRATLGRFLPRSWRKIPIIIPRPEGFECNGLLTTVDSQCYWIRVEGGEEYIRSVILSRSCASVMHSTA